MTPSWNRTFFWKKLFPDWESNFNIFRHSIIVALTLKFQQESMKLTKIVLWKHETSNFSFLLADKKSILCYRTLYFQLSKNVEILKEFKNHNFSKIVVTVAIESVKNKKKIKWNFLSEIYEELLMIEKQWTKKSEFCYRKIWNFWMFHKIWWRNCFYSNIYLLLLKDKFYLSETIFLQIFRNFSGF